MKRLLCLFMLSWVFVTPAKAEQARYISDNLFTYIHSGPSNEYRIVGSINAGDQVTLTNTNKKTGYSKIVDSRGRTGWVETRFISNQPGIAERLPKVEEELIEVKALLDTARQTANEEKSGLADSLAQRNEQIKDLEQNYSKMNQQLTASQTEVRELRAKLDTQKEDLLLRYFMYGGGVAGGGLILGLILPHLIPRRQKKPNGWA